MPRHLPPAALGQQRRERGAASAELAVATPLLLLLVLLIVQFAVWLHAVHIADAAVDQALADARARGGTATAGRAQARMVLAEIGGVLVDPTVRVTRGAATARVVVSGTAETVVPGLSLPVRATAQGPVERFVPAPE